MLTGEMVADIIAPVRSVETLFLVCQYTDPDVLAHTPKGEPGQGIQAVSLDSRTGQLTLLASTRLAPNPAFILQHPTRNVLYATTECINNNGKVYTLEVGPKGKVTVGDSVDAGGKSTCFMNIPRGNSHMLAVNYWDAKLSVLPLTEDGQVDEACSIHMEPKAEYVARTQPNREEHWAYRQRWPHSHCCVTEPYEKRYHFVCDLGQDKVFAYELDAAQGTVVARAEVSLQATQGPRHLVFHPTLRMAYIINELKNTVSSFKYQQKDLGQAYVTDVSSDANSMLVEMQTISTLPEDFQGKGIIHPNGVWKAASHCSEIRMHPNGKWLYVGNRGHESLAAYAIDQTTGLLSLIGIFPTEGECPRNFNFDVTGRFIVVGNQNTNTLKSMAIDQHTGALAVIDSVPCASPNYVFAMPYDSRRAEPIFW